MPAEHVEQSVSSPRCRPVRGALWGGPSMDGLHACCAGLDVHKRTVVACVRRVEPAGKVTKDIKTFATMTGDLLNLSDWGLIHVSGKRRRIPAASTRVRSAPSG